MKQQKVVRENIARISCKNLYKVQEEVTSLKQALSLVSNGLQRNAQAISKLKLQAAQVTFLLPHILMVIASSWSLLTNVEILNPFLIILSDCASSVQIMLSMPISLKLCTGDLHHM